jgi:hypothetical protein
MPVFSSQDIFYLVTSLSIAFVSVFLCWTLFQAGKILKNVNKIMDSVLIKLEYISEMVTFMRDKVDNVSKHMGTMSGLLGGMVEKFVVGKLTSKLSEKMESRTEKKATSKRK